MEAKKQSAVETKPQTIKEDILMDSVNDGRVVEIVAEERVRERAYAIWQQSGEPDGQDADNWQQAERELATETQ